MKKELLVLSAIASLVMAHPNHGPEDVTSGESLLWIRDELKLDAVVYKSLNEKIKLYNASKKQGCVAGFKDSIAMELKRPTPSEKNIALWTKAAGDQVEQQLAAYTKHLKDVKGVLTKEQFAQFVSFSSKVYMCPVKSTHGHEHTHADGSTHTHEHVHGGDQNDHSHSHDSSVHGHEHTHADGSTHTHTHEHGANTAQHDHTHK